MRIETTLLYAGPETSKHTKLFSVCLFRMKRSYQKFNNYLGFCVRTIGEVKRIMPDWTMRIYIDESVKEPEIRQLLADHVEIMLYKCEPFWDAESGTHEGVFGTFMRFLPFFSAQRYEVMACGDIDNAGEYQLELINILGNTATEVGLVNHLCSSEWQPEGLRYNLIANGIVSKVVFPRYMLTRFLEEVKERHHTLKIIKQTDTDTYMPYGTDEFFLNTKLYNYLEKHKVRVLTYTMSTVVPAMRRLLKAVKSDKERMEKIEPLFKKMTYVDIDFWRDPRRVRPDAFVKLLRKILDLVQPEFEVSRHRQCLEAYLADPVMIRKYKYNY